MKEQKINHLAVWICIIAFQILFFIWYSPFLFADKWMNYLGKTFSDFHGENVNGGLYFSFSGAIAFNYFLAWLFIQLKISSGAKGLSTAFIIAICCFALQTFMQDSFSLRPHGLSLINCGSIMLNFCFAGFVLGSWKKFKH